MKYASRVLPTLHAGRDDGERLIPEPILDLDDLRKDNSDQETGEIKEEN